MASVAEQPKMSPLKLWLLAARPKTLPAAAVPVIVGTGAAIGDRVFNWLPALAALLGALLIQIGTNFANDVFDFKKGADTAERLGPLRVTSAGLITPKAMFAGMWLVFGLAVLVGVYLVVVGGLPVVIIGLCSILAGIAYTGGPFPLGYNGLGDLFVFIFFGLVAVCGTYYVQALTLSPLVWWAAVPVGLLATAIIVVNNLRDVKTDKTVGKKTLAVRLGVTATRGEYIGLVAISYLVPVLMWLIGLTNAWVLLSFGSLPLVLPLVKLVMTVEGRPLNQALGGTARLELVFGILFAIGLALK
jgi:1,4-dihydroxy-2-naphthoate polyprenyltransferase